VQCPCLTCEWSWRVLRRIVLPCFYIEKVRPIGRGLETPLSLITLPAVSFRSEFLTFRVLTGVSHHDHFEVLQTLPSAIASFWYIRRPRLKVPRQRAHLSWPLLLYIASAGGIAYGSSSVAVLYPCCIPGFPLPRSWSILAFCVY